MLSPEPLAPIPSLTNQLNPSNSSCLLNEKVKKNQSHKSSLDENFLAHQTFGRESDAYKDLLKKKQFREEASDLESIEAGRAPQLLTKSNWASQKGSFMLG